MGGSKAQDVAKQIKETMGENKGSIRINEVKFVAADPATGEISVAAQIAAQTLGPEFKEWLNDPQKLLQLIAAAEGSKTGSTPNEPGSFPVGLVPSVHPSFAGGGTGTGSGGSGTGGSGGGGTGGSGTGGPGTGGGFAWDGKSTVPLQEEEVIHAIRLLTHFGKAAQTMDFNPQEFQQELVQAPPNTRVNLAAVAGGTGFAGTRGELTTRRC